MVGLPAVSSLTAEEAAVWAAVQQVKSLRLIAERLQGIERSLDYELGNIVEKLS